MTISVKILASGTAIYQKDFAFSDTMTFDETLKIIHLRFDIGDSLQFIELTILDDNTLGAALRTTKDTVVRIYDYDEGVALAKTRFADNEQVDDLFGDAEYDQKCDFAAPTGAYLGGDDYIIRMNGGFTVLCGQKQLEQTPMRVCTLTQALQVQLLPFR
ncbi:hypothetical protein F441_22569 [Phytophthora nicotianae CJ01A1]|uniref:Uncharacterized protein n=1 Tax=Phytophthora nicotianae CJ01A1 TaxID=1317063 RepID=W2VNS2_PHYNI|nr:hypothetical protein F441_22569 [Phytophthora nicotianae CJ01A1]